MNRRTFRPAPLRGLPRTAEWYDLVDRPHNIYDGEPINGLVEEGGENLSDSSSARPAALVVAS